MGAENLASPEKVGGGGREALPSSNGKTPFTLDKRYHCLAFCSFRAAVDGYRNTSMFMRQLGSRNLTGRGQAERLQGVG
jgi:hypothetical protein